MCTTKTDDTDIRTLLDVVDVVLEDIGLCESEELLFLEGVEANSKQLIAGNLENIEVKLVDLGT